VLGLVELGFLLEQAHGEALGEAGVAGELLVESRHDAQQRRLARTVGADHADLGPRVEREGDVLQHLAVRRVEPADLAHGEDELGARGRHGPPVYRLWRLTPAFSRAAQPLAPGYFLR